MDTTDVDISFDEAGVCNHCRAFASLVAARVPTGEVARRELDGIVDKIKRAGEGREYDSILGLSGGVDSSFVAYEAKRLGLRPLAVHLDNGWDSELAVQNIQNIVSRLGIDLYTHVIDWSEFRDIQLAFLKASVVDIELITDHAITALVYRLALKHKIKFVLSGNNIVTEAIMPRTWGHRKSDLRNLKAIHRRHGTRKMKTLPTASTLRLLYWQYLRKIRTVPLLDYIDYNKQEAMEKLTSELDWTYYGGKHYESVFTRFFQAYILPRKFGIDKRRAHFSALVCSGQLSREEALEQLEQPPDGSDSLDEARVYVLKKLGMSADEFDDYLRTPPRTHLVYPSDEGYLNTLLGVRRTMIRPFRALRRGAARRGQERMRARSSGDG